MNPNKFCFPEDTDKKKYKYIGDEEYSFEEIVDAAKICFPNKDIKDIKIGCEYVQVYCIGHFTNDRSDYATFLTFVLA